MWTYTIETLKSNSIQKISIFFNNDQITYSDAIELWQKDETFRSFFNTLLAKSLFKAYFWETPPITLSNVHQAFEFVLVDSPVLARVNSNVSSFQEYFQSAALNKQVITFPNLSKDALLVVPCPVSENSAYTHIAAFSRVAPQSQQNEIWQTLAEVLQHYLNEQPIWVSTSGLGVYWLHIRLDSYPKYYNFEPYKSYK
jgi:hypothetical protein